MSCKGKFEDCAGGMEPGSGVPAGGVTAVFALSKLAKLNVWQQEKLAETSTDPNELQMLLEVAYDYRVRKEIAGNQNNNSATFWALAKDSSRQVRERLLGNTSLPSDVVDFLANDEDDDVRLAAMNRMARDGEEGFTRFENDPSQSIKIKAAAWTKNTDLVNRMADDPDVYWAALDNPLVSPSTMMGAYQRFGGRALDSMLTGRAASSIPGDLLGQAHLDGHESALMANHPNTPPYAVDGMALSDDPSVRKGVALRDDVTRGYLDEKGLLADPNPRVREAAWSNSNTNPDLKDLYAALGSGDPTKADSAILRGISLNKSSMVNGNMLLILAERAGSEWEANTNFVMREDLPISAELTLARKSKECRAWLLGKDVLPDPVVDEIARLALNGDGVYHGNEKSLRLTRNLEIVNEAAASQSEAARAAIAPNPILPAADLIRDKSAKVLTGLAGRDDLTYEQFEKLSKSRSAAVRGRIVLNNAVPRRLKEAMLENEKSQDVKRRLLSELSKE